MSTSLGVNLSHAETQPNQKKDFREIGLSIGFLLRGCKNPIQTSKSRKSVD
jgi:hypothetical protein